MPHLGQTQAMTTTLRGEGAVVNRDGALYVDETLISDGELREDLGYELREDGSIELRD